MITSIGRYDQAVYTLSNIVSRDMYVSNPINAFSLVRRLTQDWPRTLSLINNELLKDFSLPKEEDFAGAVRALTRLQDVYDISAETLAQGHLPGTHRTALLTAADCVSVAQFYRARMDYTLATDWLLEALDKVYDDKTCSPAVVLENIFITTCFEGDHELSSFYLNKLLDQYPSHLPPTSHLKDYNLALSGKCGEITEARKKIKVKSIPEMPEEGIDEYNSMCRAHVSSPASHLRCHLVHYHRPHLRLQPFKLEELHLDPPVVMFHQVISNEEIKYLQHTAYPLMKPAKVRMSDGNHSVANYRTSHIAWIDDSDPISARLSRRVATLTNLHVSSAEMNQVNNYGLAGEYATHLDAVEGVNLTQGDPDGNRLATFMIYMSDVIWGGHTVFLDLDLSVRPVKGSALFWYNLHQDGSVDYRMRHASCPVIVGNKWVLNKWLHEKGQDLNDYPPCKLRREDSWSNFYL
ncbi:prolyl 4-hydroxylase subunit alpha-1-like isoform X2 [Macrosteles quadrilineatus]|uniref:prolyl 4-hydroxylase subunit alpha-1-like isoform X2 n=1 Tax=Macrosteles quadrilineatus TaxID=74068 RepID=UPI0023E239D7|nr:prolyl 4-hydroxylase subunit alpha-1-like isoform X2 [Macrosteles quadrilineatus]